MKYQNKLGEKTQCTVCPRNCILKENQRGFCHVRQNVGGDIILTSHGYNTGLAIDPIEKKPLYHFYPSSKVLSFGTVGCNLGCKFCQNWQTSKSKIEPQRLNKATPEQIVQLAKAHKCKSVAFTYNEPTIFLEYAIETAKACKENGILTVAVTDGYINKLPRLEFFKYIDAVNIDLKAFTEKFYKRNCLASLAPVLETIKYVCNETNTWLELTTLLIEGENDNETELNLECEWIVENLNDKVPLHFSAFHPAYKFNQKTATQISTLFKAIDIAKSKGIKYVYAGNVSNVKTSSTYCSNCNKPLIVRMGHFLVDYNLDDNGCCKYCATKCNGYFDVL